MARHQRISNLEKYTVVSAAAFVDAGHVLIGLAQNIPIMGVSFVMVDYFVSMMSFFGFTAWYIKVGGTRKRIGQRIALNILILFASMIFSGVPYGGPFIAFILMMFFTVRTYFFISSLQKEDLEEAKKLDEKAQLIAKGAVRAVNTYSKMGRS